MLAEGSRQTHEINIFYWQYYCLMKDSNELERNFRIPPTCPHFLQDKLLRKSRSDRWHYPWSPTGPLLLKRMEMYKSTGLVSVNEEEGLVHNPINIILSVNNDSNVNFLFTISSKQNLMWNLLTDPSLPINYEVTAAKVFMYSNRLLLVPPFTHWWRHSLMHAYIEEENIVAVSKSSNEYFSSSLLFRDRGCVCFVSYAPYSVNFLIILPAWTAIKCT